MAALCGTLALALTGCPGGETGGPDAGTSCAKKCDGKCCSKEQTTCHATTNACCAPVACGTKECGDDGCGNPCGTCGSGSTCSADFKCVSCTRETKTQFCARLATSGKQCGSITEKDNCSGEARTEDCGACANGRGCTPENTCTGSCETLTIPQFCKANNKNCGSFTGQDCDKPRTENCGTCSSGTCVSNVCEGCVDTETETAFCTRMKAEGKECGVISDKDLCLADKTVDCGFSACGTGKACNATTHKCEACTAETTAQFCARQAALGKECGSITANDACSGTSRTVDCGSTACVNGATCSATTNKCSGGTAPANDKCAAAQDITSATMPVTGTTKNATNDGEGTCADYYPQDGGDVVYKFTTTDKKSVTITVNPASTSSGYYASVYLKATDCAAATDVACAGSDYSGDSEIKVNELAAGTYYVIVDGEDASEGDFQLTVTFAAPIIPPANDSCTAPAALTGTLDAQGNGTITVTGDTSAAKGDTSALGSCGGMGNDVVYALTTTAAKDVKVKMEFADTAQTPVIYLRKGACNTTTATDELKCQSGTSGIAEFTARRVPAGTNHIWADGYSSSKGAFTLTVTLSDPAPAPTNDACGTAGASATKITLDAAGHGQVTGDTDLAAANDAVGTCHASGSGRDVVYLLDTTTMGERNVTAVLDFATSGSYAFVYLRKVCESAAATDEVGCEYDYSKTATLVKKHLPAGKYYLWVDSGTGDEGAYTLTVDAVVPPPPAVNDSCTGTPTAINLVAGTPATTLTGSVTGDTKTATDDDAKGSCETTSGNDLVYQVDTTGKGVKNITAKVVFTDTTASASVYIWKACGTAADQIACDHPYDATATALAKRAPEGKYFVWVDQYAGDEGPFTLTIEAADPPPSPCPTAAALTFTNNVATATGTTVGKANYTTGSCGGSTGNDQLHKMVLAADQKVTLTVTPDAASTSYIPVVYLRKDCESELAADQLGCDAAYAGGDPATFSLKYVKAGTYFVWVDSDEEYDYYGSGGGPTSGAYSLEAKLEAPVLPPANDTCGTAGAAAVALTKGAAATAGDTTDAIADYGTALSAACYADMDSYNAKGKDVVYKYTPAAAGDFTVELVTTNFDGALWYTTGTCGGDGSTCIHAADAKIGSGTETLVVTGAAAGTTYYIYVDSYSSTAGGAYTIAIK